MYLITVEAKDKNSLHPECPSLWAGCLGGICIKHRQFQERRAPLLALPTLLWSLGAVHLMQPTHTFSAPHLGHSFLHCSHPASLFAESIGTFLIVPQGVLVTHRLDELEAFSSYTCGSLCQRWTNVPALPGQSCLHGNILSPLDDPRSTEEVLVAPFQPLSVYSIPVWEPCSLNFPYHACWQLLWNPSLIHWLYPSLEATGTLQTQLSHAQFLDHARHQLVDSARNQKYNVLFWLFCLFFSFNWEISNLPYEFRMLQFMP